MKKRSFRVYAVEEDLQEIFKEYQNTLSLYYVPTYSDTDENNFKDISEIENLGINFFGSHIGNMQILVFPSSKECVWRSVQCKGNGGQTITRYSTLDVGNLEYIEIDLNGIYQEQAIFPSTISTMFYDNKVTKKLYDELKQIVRKKAIKIINGFYICKQAYAFKEKYRFCTIDIKSPQEYDLKIE